MWLAKELTANDLGLTGAHQGGIHVPKGSPLLRCLPMERAGHENPRVALVLRDAESNLKCHATLIFYNNIRRGGTREEYRITGTTAFLRALGAEVGDELQLSQAEGQQVTVRVFKKSDKANLVDAPMKLSGKWRYIGGNS